MKKFIEWCIQNRLLVIIFITVLVILSIWSLNHIKLDAVPDLSDTQVIIQAKFPGQPPQVIEDQVTYPLTTRMLSVPYAKTVRGYSFFGFSLVYVLFEDGTDLYWARSRVLEYLNSMQGKLPKEVQMELGPDATSIGWIFEYAIRDTSGKLTLADLRDIQDFLLRYELTSVKGVSEVASVGGFRRQFQIEVNPDLLFQYKLTLNQVEMALKRGNMEMGARLFEQAETEYMVLAKGYISSIQDIQSISIRVTEEGSVLRLGDIAKIREGPDIRRGLVDLNGEGEVVGGIVVMRQGGDVPGTIARVKEKLESLKKSLPKGVEIVVTYDRSELIEEAVSNLTFKLIEELIVVSLITFLFLFHVRSALVALIVLPIGVLSSFLLMYLLGIPVNIMSMGGIAIAIGVMVDASVVMVENTHKHLEKLRSSKSNLNNADYWQAAKDAVFEVAPGLFWSMIIIVVSFLPVFALPEQSGRLFIPLALTKTFAMTMAAILAVVLMPILVGYFIRGQIRKEENHPVSRKLINSYEPILTWCLNNKKTVLLTASVFALLSLIPIFGIPNPFYEPPPKKHKETKSEKAPKDTRNWFVKKEQILKPIGEEFMPPLEEGDLLYMPTTIPGISISKAREILIKTDKLIKEIPEVHQVFGKIGRADTPTDPAPLTMIETTILLKDKSEWRDGFAMSDIIDELDKKVRMPGLVNAWTMPIKTRIDMLSTGIKTPIGVKVMGDNLQHLQHIAEQLEGHLSQIEGVTSVFGERTRGGNYIIYEIDRDKAGVYGLNVMDIHGVLSKALGGKKVTDIIFGQYRWSANIRYLRSYRDSLEDLNRIYIPLPKGRGQIPISAVLKDGKFKIEKGPAMIKTENSRKTSWLYVDTRETDIGSLVENIESTIENLIAEKKIKWHSGFSYLISGQYEQMKLASDRMKILIPLVILIVFIILFMYFRNVSNPAFVMSTALLFAPIGGLWLMYISGFNRSVASDVGFIAIIGLAAETAVIMLIYLNSSIASSVTSSLHNLREQILSGSLKRVRPVIMTALTDMLALTPLFWGDEPGNVAMRRIAAPMVGGSITALIVTLILVPVLFEWWHTKKFKEEKK